MALRATDEPRFIKLMTTPKRKETMTALRGMGKLGETCLLRLGRLDCAVFDDVFCRELKRKERKGKEKELYDEEGSGFDEKFRERLEACAPLIGMKQRETPYRGRKTRPVEMLLRFLQ